MMKTKLLSLITVVTLSISPSCFAYYCSGTVSYLSVDAAGEVNVALTNSTPIHKICNVNGQGSYLMTVASCKTAYATLLAARIADKGITIGYDFYNKNGLSCGTFPV